MRQRQNNVAKIAGAQVDNPAGTASIVDQKDSTGSNDAIASVASGSTGRVVVTFKTGYFTSTPIVVAAPHDSVNNNWVCSVNSVSSTSAEIYTFNTGTTLTNFNFSIMAIGS